MPAIYLLLNLFAGLFLFLSYKSGIDYPAIWPDEVLFFSPAFDLHRTGTFSTSVLSGLIPGMEHSTLWMPPVYMISLAAIFKVFPDTIETARMFSSFIGLGTVFIFYRITLALNLSNLAKILGVVLLFTDLVFFKISHSARMESICLLFGLTSILFTLEKRNSFGIGFLLGLSFLSHPFGIVYSIPIASILFFEKRFTWKEIIYSGFGFLIPILIWGIYVFPRLELFQIQFGAQLGRKKDLLGKFSYLTKFKIILSTFKYPLFKFTVVLLGVVAFLFTIKNWEKKSIWILVYLGTIFVFLILSSEMWYVFHLVPALVLFSIQLLEYKTKLSKFFIFASLNYNLSVLGILIFSIFFSNKIINTTFEFYTKLDEMIEDRDGIYLQAIPDPFFYLKEKYPSRRILEFVPGELPLPKEKIQETAKQLSVFVFYNEELMNETIRNFLKEHSNEFERKELILPKPRFSEIEYTAVVYLRKKIIPIQ
ncbi:MAG: glycosyltransferase family 39 protein [Leptospiraceae bacterium]|nr:glycosyltransferase family 39 protein [Leptospiraceae bacterium]